MKKVIRLTEDDLTRLVKRVIKEQVEEMDEQGAMPIKSQQVQKPVAPAPQGSATAFNPTVKGGYEVDCKSKLVRLTGNNIKLTKEANSSLVDLFCSPNYRAPLNTTSPTSRMPVR
jgi:hypothetical protein